MERNNVLKVREQTNIGRSKYLVNFCTGQTHADGSDFYDLVIFKNKKKKEAFVTALWVANDQGLIVPGFWPSLA
jgi:hypothetical protein